MEIKLENNIVLSSDENQLTLRKEIGVDKEGKTTYKSGRTTLCISVEE